MEIMKFLIMQTHPLRKHQIARRILVSGRYDRTGEQSDVLERHDFTVDIFHSHSVNGNTSFLFIL
jgi:hypothetical protein